MLTSNFTTCYSAWMSTSAECQAATEKYNSKRRREATLAKSRYPKQQTLASLHCVPFMQKKKMKSSVQYPSNLKAKELTIIKTLGNGNGGETGNCLC